MRKETKEKLKKYGQIALVGTAGIGIGYFLGGNSWRNFERTLNKQFGRGSGAKFIVRFMDSGGIQFVDESANGAIAVVYDMSKEVVKDFFEDLSKHIAKNTDSIMK